MSAEAMKTLQVKLDRNDSLELLERIAETGLDWCLVDAGDFVFTVMVEGIDTVHDLVLKSDGTWHMTTHLEV